MWRRVGSVRRAVTSAGIGSSVNLAVEAGSLAIFRPSLKDYDMRRIVESSVQPEPVAKGRRLWVQRCAHCHDPLGQPSPRALGPSLNAETVKSRGEEKTRQAIAIGSARMPGFQYTLQPAQIDQLIKFLNTVPMGNREPC